ncbi:hypothetical protein HK405_008982 [Cladochytrium tenue]|nr:hypothetical protein HK405_008982 [Cladochytrium tenue]
MSRKHQRHRSAAIRTHNAHRPLVLAGSGGGGGAGGAGAPTVPLKTVTEMLRDARAAAAAAAASSRRRRLSPDDTSTTVAPVPSAAAVPLHNAPGVVVAGALPSPFVALQLHAARSLADQHRARAAAAIAGPLPPPTWLHDRTRPVVVPAAAVAATASPAAGAASADSTSAVTAQGRLFEFLAQAWSRSSVDSRAGRGPPSLLCFAALAVARRIDSDSIVDSSTGGSNGGRISRHNSSSSTSTSTSISSSSSRRNTGVAAAGRSLLPSVIHLPPLLKQTVLAARAALAAAGDLPRMPSARCRAFADPDMRICDLSHSGITLPDLLNFFLPSPPPPPSPPLPRSRTHYSASSSSAAVATGLLQAATAQLSRASGVPPGGDAVPESWEDLVDPPAGGDADTDPVNAAAANMASLGLAFSPGEPDHADSPALNATTTITTTTITTATRPPQPVAAELHTLRLSYTRATPDLRLARQVAERGASALWSLSVGGCFDAASGPAAVSLLGHGLRALRALDLAGCAWLTLDVLLALPWRPAHAARAGAGADAGDDDDGDADSNDNKAGGGGGDVAAGVAATPAFLPALRLLGLAGCPAGGGGDARAAFRALAAARPRLLVAFRRGEFARLEAELLAADAADDNDDDGDGGADGR